MGDVSTPLVAVYCPRCGAGGQTYATLPHVVCPACGTVVDVGSRPWTTPIPPAIPTTVTGPSLDTAPDGEVWAKRVAGATVVAAVAALALVGAWRYASNTEDPTVRAVVATVYGVVALSIMTVVGVLFRRKRYPFSLGFAFGGLCFPIALLFVVAVPERR